MHFCSVCGSQLVTERLAQPHGILRVATLDEDPGAKPIIPPDGCLLLARTTMNLSAV